MCQTKHDEDENCMIITKVHRSPEISKKSVYCGWPIEIKRSIHDCGYVHRSGGSKGVSFPFHPDSEAAGQTSHVYESNLAMMHTGPNIATLTFRINSTCLTSTLKVLQSIPDSKVTSQYEQRLKSMHKSVTNALAKLTTTLEAACGQS